MPLAHRVAAEASLDGWF